MIEVGIWGIHWIVDVLQATDVKEGIIGPMITDWHIMTEVDTLHHLSTTAGFFCEVLCFISQLSGWNACFWMHKYSSCRTFCLLNWQTNWTWTWTWWVGFFVILYYHILIQNFASVGHKLANALLKDVVREITFLDEDAMKFGSWWGILLGWGWWDGDGGMAEHTLSQSPAKRRQSISPSPRKSLQNKR